MTRDLSGWVGCAPLSHGPMAGRFASLKPLSLEHAAGLHAAFDGDEAGWAYLPYGPLDRDGWDSFIPWACDLPDTLFFTIFDAVSGVPSGLASYLRIMPAHGVAEVGHIHFAPALQGTRAATEAMALMMARVFDAGYRRYEWKCNARNLASRRAAQRLGFSFEGVFRQHMVVKGDNRDTAWFAMTDGDWPALQRVHASWLEDCNFAADGTQKQRLSPMTAPLLHMRDPRLSE